MNYTRNKTTLEENGYAIVNNLYSNTEIDQIIDCIAQGEQETSSFHKTKDLFAIRQLMKNIPELSGLLFNQKLITLIDSFSTSDYFLTKAIYFDKPSMSNWFVAYHQDLSISVDQKTDLDNYKNWTFKKGQYGVQPPLHILQNTITIRIHLDDTDKNNGALKVIPKSHLEGIIRVESKEWDTKKEHICEVKKGGIMLMKPLTLHASNRTLNDKQRRVIHLEFNSLQLHEPLNWLEYLMIKDEV
ncbi:phytanoyl-CoA dioxygenase family protein [Aquimarina sp. 2201CG1-2-11]|uniref:phytanoyl-CoA dioxygenase family protein n=1 Tax=Aquimarina discodermiae TaxID=3231043 RepID=UPI00346216F8